jgi:tRNA pseudouridine38-40 synthase
MTEPARTAVLLTLAYDGSPFAGFVVQPEQRTIAGELLGALQALDPSIRYIRGASRTDSGVHAHGQRVAFDPTVVMPMRGWVLATSRHLPKEITVRRAAKVPAGYTPRFDSQGKHYRYLLLRDMARDPFLEARAWRLEGMRDPEVLARAAAEAELAVGTHDFAAFRTAVDMRQDTIRTLRSVRISEDPSDPRILRVDVLGNSFMHNMVRILVGTIVDVARGRLEPGAISRAIASGQRDDAGITAPPDGLYLEHIKLGDDGEEAWPPDPGEDEDAHSAERRARPPREPRG